MADLKATTLTAVCATTLLKSIQKKSVWGIITHIITVKIYGLLMRGRKGTKQMKREKKLTMILIFIFWLVYLSFSLFAVIQAMLLTIWKAIDDHKTADSYIQ